MGSTTDHPSQHDNSQEWKKIGCKSNYWWWHEDHGFDLTRPNDPNEPQRTGRIALNATNSPITIAPEKTALIIIDMQNYFLSRSLGRSGDGHAAEDALLRFAIPAARKAEIQVVWLTWGVSEADLESMDPTTARTFAFQKGQKRRLKLTSQKDPSSAAHTRLAEGEMELFCGGIGSDIGSVQLQSGVTVPGGRLLMREQWNTALHAPLEAAYQEGLRLPRRPDVRFYKNRLSGMRSEMTDCTDFLRKNGIRTLLFGGVNTDQCVLANIQDANHQGFDTVLLKDGSATNSPEGAQASTENNCQKSWGFLTTCKELARAIYEES